jgi:hypothetical protein
MNAFASGFGSAFSNSGSLQCWRRSVAPHRARADWQPRGAAELILEINVGERCAVVVTNNEGCLVDFFNVPSRGKRRCSISSGIRRLPALAPAATTRRLPAGLSRLRLPLQSRSRDVSPRWLPAVLSGRCFFDQIPHIGEGQKLHDLGDG